MKKSLATMSALALALTLAACSGQEPAEPEQTAPTQTVETPEITASPSTASEESKLEDTGYAFATGMTFGKVVPEGKPGKELKAFLEAAGEVVGEKYDGQLTFWTVKIDNREGTEEAFPNEFRAYDAAGNEFIFLRDLEVVEAVNDALPDDAGIYDEYITAFEASQYGANPGAVKEFTVSTGDELPDDFKKMTIDLGGLIGEADVIPLEEAEAQGYPLDF